MTILPPSVSLGLSGRSVIVTGGTKGLGRIIAEAFLEAGCRVAICARKEPDSLPSAGGRTARFHACDVRDAAACRAFVDSVAEEAGGLDVLVNNAGGSPAVEAATVSPRFSESIIALNLTAPLHLAQAAYRHLAARPEGGTIVNIASIAARRPAPGTAAYGAAKAGLLNLSASLAQEWAPKVRVNAVVVGLVETEMADVTYGTPEARAAIARSIPMKRMGRGEDVARAVLYLASPLAAFVTGAALDVHGGGEMPAFIELMERHAAKA